MMRPITIAPDILHGPVPLRPLAAIEAACDLMATDRARGLAAMSNLFRGGTLPPPIKGPLAGRLITTTIRQWPDTRVRAWADRNPWLGKRFTAMGGDNIWRRWPGRLDGLFWTMNGAFGWQAVEDSPQTYRGFPFRTAIGRGIADPDCTVLKIIYEARPNPFPVRRVLDELVALGDGVYLGKAHGRLARHWRLLAYFALMEGVVSSQ